MKGFSLPVVLFTVSLGGALAAGGAYVTRQLASSSRVLARSADLDGLAEEWAARSVQSLDSTFSQVAIGASISLDPIQAPTAQIARWVTRVDSSVYWVVVEVQEWSKPLLRRRLGIAAIVFPTGVSVAPGRAWSDLP